MIKTQDEYINACNFIDSDMELYDFQLSEKMSSYEYNLYLQDTEYFLDFLYEKIRVLEELCDYLDNYIDTKIEKEEKELDEKTTILEGTMTGYMANKEQIIVPEWDSSIIVTDRDGNQLKTVEIKEQKIEGAARKVNYVKPISIQTLEENIAYAKTSDFVQTGQYLSEHKEVENKDIQETLRIFLPEESYNCIEYTPINAQIDIINNKKQYIDLRIRPSSYTKRQDPVDYYKYKDRNMDRIRVPRHKYDALEPQIDRINQMATKQNIEQTKKYKHQVNEFQKHILSKTQKSETIKSQS